MSSGLYNTHKIDFDTTLDLTRLKPYGDTMNDGKVQTSFTLPVKDDERGEEAARQIAKKMGLEEPNVAYHTALDKEFTFYVVYGSCVHSVNYEDIHVITVESDVMSMEDTNDYIREHIGRKVVMVGASTGTDAHTVGIDAIMNRKGFAGHYGLERYEMIEAYNLGSQVPNEEFIKKALELHADVLLVVPDRHPEGRAHPEPHQPHRAAGGRGPARQVRCLLRRSPYHPRAGQGAGLRRRLRRRQVCR